jgi:hypothetical protein
VGTNPNFDQRTGDVELIDQLERLVGIVALLTYESGGTESTPFHFPVLGPLSAWSHTQDSRTSSNAAPPVSGPQNRFHEEISFYSILIKLS